MTRQRFAGPQSSVFPADRACPLEAMAARTGEMEHALKVLAAQGIAVDTEAFDTA